jgi:hypothetical protein
MPLLTEVRKRFAGGQEIGEDRIERFTGADLQVIDRQASAGTPRLFKEIVHRFQVPLAEGAGIAIQEAGALEPFKAGRSIKLEIQFIIMQHMQKRDIVPAGSEDPEPYQQVVDA